MIYQRYNKKNDNKIHHTSDATFDESGFWFVEINSNNCFVSWRKEDDEDVRYVGIIWFSCLWTEYVNDERDDVDNGGLDGRINIFDDGSGSCSTRSWILYIYGSSISFSNFY